MNSPTPENHARNTAKTANPIRYLRGITISFAFEASSVLPAAGFLHSSTATADRAAKQNAKGIPTYHLRYPRQNTMTGITMNPTARPYHILNGIFIPAVLLVFLPFIPACFPLIVPDT